MKTKISIAFLFLLLSPFILFAQSPGGVGTAGLTAWWNPDVLSTGNASNWTTIYPSGGSAISLTKAAAPYAQVTATPTNNCFNYNKTIDFTGNTTTTPLFLEFAGALNLLNNATAAGTGTCFAVYFANPTATAAQHVIDYRESSNDAIQLRYLSTINSRIALATTNSVNGTRDFYDDAKPIIVGYFGNNSGVGTMQFRKKSKEHNNNPVSSSASTGGQLGLTVGIRKSPTATFAGPHIGYISELIFFNTNLPFGDLIKVESYLGVKYGITLDITGAAGGAYSSSASGAIWQSTSTPAYHNDVIGIGRDDISTLQQKQSHAYSDSSKIYLSTLAATNAANTGTFTNNISYVMMGHDLGASNETATATAEMPSGQSLLNRIEREFRVTNTNFNDNFSVDITLNNFTNFSSNPADLCLLVDDDGNFSNASVFQTGLTFSVNGNVVTVSGISNTQIPMNTTQYITLATKSLVLLPIGGTAISNFNPICQGETIHLSLVGNSTYPGQTYQWQESPNGTTFTNIFGATMDTLNIAPLANTYYQCVVTLGANNATSTDTFIVVNPLPTVTASISNATICANNSTTVSESGTATSYTWSGGVTNNIAFVPMASTVYTLTGTDANLCSATSTVSVTVNPASATLANAMPGNTSSTAGTNTNTQDQLANTFISYYTSSCNLIASVSNNASAMGSTDATVTVDASVQTYNGQPFIPRWFQIIPTNNGAADVTFYITQDDFNDYNMYATANGWPLLPQNPTDVVGIANLRITKNTNAGLGNSPVVLTPSSVMWNSSNNYWEVLVATPSFSQFRFHSLNPNNAALPVELVNFTVNKAGSVDLVNWQTSNEQNNAYFNLQRSANGVNYETIGVENSKAPNGNSNILLSYEMIDEAPMQGHNYYRLEQVDLDGKKWYSNVIDIVWGDGGTVVIYPNPTKDVVNVDISATKTGQVEVKVMDMSGRVVKSVIAQSNIGMNNIQLNLSELASAVYTMQIIENNIVRFVDKVKKN